MTITAATVVSKEDSVEFLSNSIDSYVNYVDEIIVGDNNMTDEQRALITQTKARVIPIENIQYVELVREKLHEMATSDYILVIDPDEIVTGGLIDELKKYGETYTYIRIPRKNIIFGRWIEHSRWWPDYQLRFFKKGVVTWSKQLHSVPITAGTGFDLPAEEANALTHHNYESIDHFLSKMTRYARAESEERLNDPNYSLSVAIKKGIDEFMSRFFYAQGYKDGMHGFVLSFLQLFNAFLVYFYWWEKKKYIDEKADYKTAPFNFFRQGLKDTLFWSQRENLLNNKVSLIARKLLTRLLK